MHDQVEKLFEEVAVRRDVGCREALKEAAHKIVDELQSMECDEEFVETAVSDLYEVLSTCQSAIAYAYMNKEE